MMMSSPMRFISLLRPNPLSLSSSKPTFSLLFLNLLKKPHSKPFSITLTQYPLQYDLILSRPPKPLPKSLPDSCTEPDPGFDKWVDAKIASSRPEPDNSGDSGIFDKWVDAKIASSRPEPDNSGDSGILDKWVDAETASFPPEPDNSGDSEIFDKWVDAKIAEPGSLVPDSGDSEIFDKGKRKYYNKRRRRMYGSDSEDESRGKSSDGFVELTPEVVEFRTLHQREEELYFYDAFAYPWEKEKHYKMVYQLEKKYFPDQCFDKAFLEPGKRREKGGDGRDEKEKGLIFFEGKEEGEREKGLAKDVEKDAKKEVKIDVSEKKVTEFFQCLKKVPNEKGREDGVEPFVSTRSSGLPPKWDGPYGTMVLINKPKGWTSFTVCGKLRRLVNVKKVGHAGTLDPMATGLLIVCVGKATKVVDSYQGMIKGYSGIFHLGEATSTWDADSAVNQREPWEHIKDEDIKKAAATFCGEIWQVPPMFSAIKVGGEKMYEKARRGESMELSPRRISIFRFDIERSLDDRQNLIFRVTCSKGTYIRSLCADLGKALGSCAHLTALRRDSIGQYSADDAWDFKELEEAITKGYL